MDGDELDARCLAQIRSEYDAWRRVWLAGQPVEKLPWINDVGMTVMLECDGIFVSNETARASLDRLVARGKATARWIQRPSWIQTEAGNIVADVGVFTEMRGYTYLNLLDELARASNGD